MRVLSWELRTAAYCLAGVALAVALSGCQPREETLGLNWLAELEEAGIECQLVGQWENSGIYATVITICRQPDGPYRVHEAFGEENPVRSSQREYSAVLIPIPGGPGVRFLRDEQFTDYYEILENGSLEVGNERHV